jgi:hypothetical protein
MVVRCLSGIGWWRDCRWAKSIAAKDLGNPGLRFLASARVADDGAFHDGVGILVTPTLFATLSDQRGFPIMV